MDMSKLREKMIDELAGDYAELEAKYNREKETTGFLLSVLVMTVGIIIYLMLCLGGN